MSESKSELELIDSLKQCIKEQLNEYYTTYENECLDRLLNKLEHERDSVIYNVLNDIDISFNKSIHYPTQINITIVHK